MFLKKETIIFQAVLNPCGWVNVWGREIHMHLHFFLGTFPNLFGQNLLQEGVCRGAWGTIDGQANSNLAKTLRSWANSTSRGRSPGRQRREVLRRCLGRSGRPGSPPEAIWCGWASPAWKKSNKNYKKYDSLVSKNSTARGKSEIKKRGAHLISLSVARGRSVWLKGTREFTRLGMIHCWVNAMIKCVKNITYKKLLRSARCQLTFKNIKSKLAPRRSCARGTISWFCMF